MKRKLISYDVFENIQTSSLSTAERELLGAEPILANALEVESLSLVCYGAEDALYESHDGTYIHANYKMNESSVKFNQIEQLVIDEATEANRSKDVLTQMLDAVLDGNDTQAESLFNTYIGIPAFKRNITEAVDAKANVKKKKKLNSKLGKKKAPKSIKLVLGFKTKGEKAKKMREWAHLCENIQKYAEFKEYGQILKESVIGFDDKGNVNNISVPTLKARNEAKMLSFNWKTLDTDVKVLRGGAKQLAENIEFCKQVAVLKRQNALSDSEKLQEALEDIVSRWPNVLYLTQEELASVIAEALNTVAAVNYDDQTCDFMAEAILRTAHGTYVDRVSKILALSGVKAEDTEEDAFETFSRVSQGFFPTLDENAALEMQAYIDLYEALRSVYGIADSNKNETLKSETASHLHELAAIIEQQVEPSIDVAIAAAEYLSHLVETNLESGEWSVSNNVHTTVSGDHPRMAQNAKQGYAPSSDFSGDYGDEAPVSDGNSYKNGQAKEMRNNSWGNIGGDGTYPSLSNPYVPKTFGDYKIKGEKNIDSDSDLLGHSGGSDTWPALQNPYTPNAETPKSYQMNNGKEADLVVNK